MRISDTEPSSVILSQTKYFKKLKNDAQKLPKQAKAKGDIEFISCFKGQKDHSFQKYSKRDKDAQSLFYLILVSSAGLFVFFLSG